MRGVLAVSHPGRRRRVSGVATAVSCGTSGDDRWILSLRRVRGERDAVADHVAAVDRRQGRERQLLLRDDAGVDGDAERAVRPMREKCSRAYPRGEGEVNDKEDEVRVLGCSRV